jgi:UDP-N-acetylglucosamine diphosphorylase/glucosamine-1-phosphate N-acetyltransferase
MTKDHLQEKFTLKVEDENLLINSCLIPDSELFDHIMTCPANSAFILDQRLLFAKMTKDETLQFKESGAHSCRLVNVSFSPDHIKSYCDIFSKNGYEIRKDYDLITKGRKSEKLSETNKVLNPESIFLEKGAIVEFSTLNASTGPIYIGKDAEIMENSVVRGPFALCEHSTLKMSSKIYGPTTVGPYSKVGGEVNNSVIFGYSNKAHDGFLGNSVIGEWCNLGADTNNSNLKNNYASVKMWNYPKKQFVNTGLMFAGLIMGDHSKCGINTMFNTGTVVGVSANLFGSGFHRNFVPSFTWGGPAGSATFDLSKALEIAKIVMSRRNIELNEIEKNILQFVFDYTEVYRDMKAI